MLDCLDLGTRRRQFTLHQKTLLQLRFEALSSFFYRHCSRIDLLGQLSGALLELCKLDLQAKDCRTQVIHLRAE